MPITPKTGSLFHADSQIRQPCGGVVNQREEPDRSPGLPIKPGRCQTPTHDYKRHGTSPGRKGDHAVLDNYGTHKHPRALAWLARHPRWIFHFTPTSASQRRDRRLAGLAGLAHGAGGGIDVHRAAAPQICVVLSAVEREQLSAIVADRNRPRKHVEAGAHRACLG